MAKAIDHKARRERIVEESVKLFARFGYAKVNFGMIANKCGLSRTILYMYFKDKRAIFNEAIRDVTQQIRSTYNVAKESAISASERLKIVCEKVASVIFDNRDFMCVIVDVLANARRRGNIDADRVREHTVGLMHILKRFLSEGIASGEFLDCRDVDSIAKAFYSQFEAIALRIAITDNANRDEALAIIESLICVLKSTTTRVIGQLQG